MDTITFPDTGTTGIPEAALALHPRLRGKVETVAKAPLTAGTLKLLYTPGVGSVCERLADDPSAAAEQTGRSNWVAVVSDGSAVLGLGCEGPIAALPQGKELLFRALGGIDAVPIALDAADADAVIAPDSSGPLSAERDDLDDAKRGLVRDLGLEAPAGDRDPLSDAEVVIGLSGPGGISVDQISRMADQPIVFVLANSEPELDPDEARQAGAAVVATGRADFPNQINSVLAFLGIFRGLLDAARSNLSDVASPRAATALARLVAEPSADRIVPDVLDERVVPAVAAAVSGAADGASV